MSHSEYCGFFEEKHKGREVYPDAIGKSLHPHEIFMTACKKGCFSLPGGG